MTFLSRNFCSVHHNLAYRVMPIIVMRLNYHGTVCVYRVAETKRENHEHDEKPSHMMREEQTEYTKPTLKTRKKYDIYNCTNAPDTVSPPNARSQFNNTSVTLKEKSNATNYEAKRPHAGGKCACHLQSAHRMRLSDYSLFSTSTLHTVRENFQTQVTEHKLIYDTKRKTKKSVPKPSCSNSSHDNSVTHKSYLHSAGRRIYKTLYTRQSLPRV